MVSNTYQPRVGYPMLAMIKLGKSQPRVYISLTTRMADGYDDLRHLVAQKPCMVFKPLAVLLLLKLLLYCSLISSL
jgi:hypothetical protein